MIKYEKYAMGHDLKNRMPLWIKPEKQLDVKEVMELMRDHYEGTPMDMTKDLGAGPFACPYRWRPMGFSVNGQEYVHERATSTQQTGFSFVAQSRSWMPDNAKGILWFGVDDTYSTVYVPMYCAIERVPRCFEVGNGSMVEYSETSAFWLFNLVTNMAYSRYSDMIKDIRKEQNGLEQMFIREVKHFDEKLKNAKSAEEIAKLSTNFSLEKADQMMKSWRKLSQFLLVKYIDGNIKKETNGRFEESPYRKGQCVFPEQPKYPQQWYEMIVKDHGDVIKVPATK
jgi:dipeptidase